MKIQSSGYTYYNCKYVKACHSAHFVCMLENRAIFKKNTISVHPIVSSSLSLKKIILIGGQLQYCGSFCHVSTCVVCVVSVKSLSHVRLFVTPWMIKSMEFSRPEYWNG